jgi:hypothetical protein
MPHHVPSEPPVIRGYGGEPIEQRPVRVLPFALWVAGLALLLAVGTCGDVEREAPDGTASVEAAR